jgi:hypothetical protein
MAAVALGIVGVTSLVRVQASDHDDGETDLKGRSLNLTDLYVFREDWQTGNAADNGNLILIMNTNPRSLARQQYYFSTNARYEFHLDRIGTVSSAAVTAQEDILLRFEFGPPNAAGVQAITLTVVRQGVGSASVNAGSTTPLSAGAPTINNVVVSGSTLTVFAGLREDPFFFDVEQYFRTRGTGVVSFQPVQSSKDFAVGYNVNAIVVRVPIAFLQTAGAETVFDVWETISRRS